MNFLHIYIFLDLNSGTNVGTIMEIYEGRIQTTSHLKKKNQPNGFFFSMRILTTQNSRKKKSSTPSGRM